VPPRSAADSAIADRTKAGLAAAKARGIKLGNAKLAVEAHKGADTLNGRQIATPTGRPWSAKTVLRVRERLAA
jgi:hypothetical protein